MVILVGEREKKGLLIEFPDPEEIRFHVFQQWQTLSVYFKTKCFKELEKVDASDLWS